MTTFSNFGSRVFSSWYIYLSSVSMVMVTRYKYRCKHLVSWSTWKMFRVLIHGFWEGRSVSHGEGTSKYCTSTGRLLSTNVRDDQLSNFCSRSLPSWYNVYQWLGLPGISIGVIKHHVSRSTWKMFRVLIRFTVSENDVNKTWFLRINSLSSLGLPHQIPV
jgi:hypothetical protein